jgi:hypothetical protein
VMLMRGHPQGRPSASEPRTLRIAKASDKGTWRAAGGRQSATGPSRSSGRRRRVEATATSPIPTCASLRRPQISTAQASPPQAPRSPVPIVTADGDHNGIAALDLKL